MAKQSGFPTFHLGRRGFLKASGATAVSSAALTHAARANAQSSSISSSSAPELVDPPAGTLPFLHGVASGDPIPDSVVLWTRVTPDAAALPGSGAGAATKVRWEVATDDAFGSIVASGEETTSASADHTLHVDPHGLQPGTVYFYRFVVTDGPHAGATSPVGRTKTAPPLGSSPEEVTFAVASCANWESGFFSAYADMAARGRHGEFDATVFLGDYIYEYAVGKYSGAGPVRHHHPAHEIISLADYRTRFGRYRTDADLQAAHAALPWIVVWDDHETANNSWRGGAENHSADEGEWIARRDAAMQAYFEWLPVRATSPSQQGHIYRSLSFGDLVELTMMDLRTYRDEPLNFAPVRFNDEGRTMLGSEQYTWLMNKIETSGAAWNVMGNSVMFSPLNLISLQQNQQTEEVSSTLSSSNVSGIPVNGDQWDGYSAERRALLDALSASGSTALFLTGDIHTEWAHNIAHNGANLGAELVCASISAPNIDEQLRLPQGNAISRLAEDILSSANPHCRHVDLDHHGYSYVRIRRDEAQMHWLRVDNITAQNSPVRDAIALTWRKDQGFLQA